MSKSHYYCERTSASNPPQETDLGLDMNEVMYWKYEKYQPQTESSLTLITRNGKEFNFQYEHADRIYSALIDYISTRFQHLPISKQPAQGPSP